MSIPNTFWYDWIANGKSAEIRDYMPDDTSMETAINELRAGLSAKHFAADAIETTQLADDSVTTAKIVDDNVTTAKIADDNVTGPKIAAGAFRLFTSFSGVDGSGVEPALSCTLAGVSVGDKVIGLIDFATGLTAASKFESVITVDDEIQQSALEDLSTDTFLVMVLAGS